MINPPSLPANVSPNGEELWDWAGKAGQWIQIQARIQELKLKIRKIGTECGDCSLWMTNICPFEVNKNGRKYGPSMSHSICDKFAMKDWTVEHKRNLQKELTNLENPATLSI